MNDASKMNELQAMRHRDVKKSDTNMMLRLRAVSGSDIWVNNDQFLMSPDELGLSVDHAICIGQHHTGLLAQRLRCR